MFGVTTLKELFAFSLPCSGQQRKNKAECQIILRLCHPKLFLQRTLAA